jgi:hypothetical protein
MIVWGDGVWVCGCPWVSGCLGVWGCKCLGVQASACLGVWGVRVPVGVWVSGCLGVGSQRWGEMRIEVVRWGPCRGVRAGTAWVRWGPDWSMRGITRWSTWQVTYLPGRLHIYLAGYISYSFRSRSGWPPQYSRLRSAPH